MQEPIARHHWLNVYCGLLDTAFYLTDEELFYVADIVGKLLRVLQIEDRYPADVLPLPLVQEIRGRYFTIALAARDTGIIRTARAVTDADAVASLEAWRDSLTSMLTATYPDLTPSDRLQLSSVLHDVLASLGIPNRAAAFHPDNVVAAHQRDGYGG